MKQIAIAFFLVSSVFVAACGSDSTTSSSSGTSGGTSGSSGASGGTSGSSGGTTNNVVVKSNEFAPAALSIKVGDTVTWTWAGGSHDVVSGANCTDDGKFKSTLQSANGATFSHTFTEAGTFEYYCTPHCQSAGMKATVTVQ